MLRSWPFRQIDILAGADDQKVKDAKKLAAKHDAEELPALPYTESAGAKWVLLYNHVRRGQIKPRDIKAMRTDDLEFLAGAVHPGIDPDELTKLTANVTRATRELQRRTAIKTATFSTLLGAGLGILVTLLALK